MMDGIGGEMTVVELLNEHMVLILMTLVLIVFLARE
jgi:hypothetical protein